MKNHRFLWLRNRTTNNRKCEKARNIKEKRTIEMFNTALQYLHILNIKVPYLWEVPYTFRKSFPLMCLHKIPIWCPFITVASSQE